jgi:hypothetical protein
MALDKKTDIVYYDSAAGKTGRANGKTGSGTMERMTVAEATAARGIESFDYALPQGFVDELRTYGEEARGNFVWSYGPGCGIFGLPAAITAEGDAIASRLPECGPYANG